MIFDTPVLLRWRFPNDIEGGSARLWADVQDEGAFFEPGTVVQIAVRVLTVRYEAVPEAFRRLSLISGLAYQNHARASVTLDGFQYYIRTVQNGSTFRRRVTRITIDQPFEVG